MKDNQQSNLTEKQMKLLQFYKEFYKQHKTYPAMKIVTDYFGVARQTIGDRIDALVKKGYFGKDVNGKFIPTSKKY